jgi:hypothetical protein
MLIAYDGTDPDAEKRRLDARPGHLEKIKMLKEKGSFLFGGAILNEEGKMIGSMVMYEFPDMKALEESLKDEPYINSGVWKEYKIVPFRLARIE